jgi:hypothetical protein
MRNRKKQPKYNISVKLKFIRLSVPKFCNAKYKDIKYIFPFFWDYKKLSYANRKAVNKHTINETEHVILSTYLSLKYSVSHHVIK